MLQLRLLGGFEARLPSGQTVEISGKKTQALMAFLALNAGKKLPARNSPICCGATAETLRPAAACARRWALFGAISMGSIRSR